MNICGVLVHAHPDQVEPVEAALAVMPGVEIHGRNDHGRLIVTVEDTDDQAAIDGLASIHKVSGVIAAALVYHHFEPALDAGATQGELNHG